MAKKQKQKHHIMTTKRLPTTRRKCLTNHISRIHKRKEVSNFDKANKAIFETGYRVDTIPPLQWQKKKKVFYQSKCRQRCVTIRILM